MLEVDHPGRSGTGRMLVAPNRAAGPLSPPVPVPAAGASALRPSMMFRRRYVLAVAALGHVVGDHGALGVGDPLGAAVPAVGVDLHRLAAEGELEPVGGALRVADVVPVGVVAGVRRPENVDVVAAVDDAGAAAEGLTGDGVDHLRVAVEHDGGAVHAGAGLPDRADVVDAAGGGAVVAAAALVRGVHDPLAGLDVVQVDPGLGEPALGGVRRGASASVPRSRRRLVLRAGRSGLLAA